jgi:ribosome-binding protein aMBF1 (putative translation factor)
MAKRKTIGDNPLDAFKSPNEMNNDKEDVEEDSIQPRRPKHSKKQRITVQISEDVIDRIKNAVYWTPGVTLASLAEEAFSKIVDEIEKSRGTPFPKRKDELKTGRPIK